MATQLSILQIGGTIDQLTFYKKRGEYKVKRKSAISAARIASDPIFERTRENGRQFGRAGRNGKLLRQALRPLLVSKADDQMISRMVKRLLLCMKADPITVRGEQTLDGGDLSQLQGFDFNSNGPLSTVLYAPYTSSLDRVSGQLDLNVPAFVPVEMLSAPEGASHYKILIAGTAIDFGTDVQEGSYEYDKAESAFLAIGTSLSTALSLSVSVSANNTRHLILAMAVKFYQDFNGVKYALKNGSSDAVAIIGVDQA